MSAAADTANDDLAVIGVYDEGDMGKPLPGRDIGKVADSEHVRRRHALLRFTLSNGHGAFLLETVLLCGLPRIVP